MSDATPRLTENNRLALLMHGASDKGFGKMGLGLLRYGASPTVAVIDREKAGRDAGDVTGIARARGIPIVASVREALTLGPDTLVPAIAPPGGGLPPDWLPEICEGMQVGLSLVNGLHAPLAHDPVLAPLITRPGQFIWDIRQEPPGLTNALGRAREVAAKRVVFVGTDMSVGKMTAALEMDRAARARGIRSRFLATGQVGIAIAGDGIALDAVRVDFAAGAVEQMVLRHADGHDILLVEGQGSLLHPASTATLPLLRGAMPTHLILVHRAGQRTIFRAPWVTFPPLPDVIRLYELVASAAGALADPAPRVVGIALNTGHIADDAEARRAIDETAQQTGLPVTDAVRFDPAALLESIQ